METTLLYRNYSLSLADEILTKSYGPFPQVCYTIASMHRIYTIVKKNSKAHQAALDSRKVKNGAIVAVAGSHVLVPSVRSIDMGYNVSHAKNRTKRARMPNTQSVKVDIGGKKISIKLSNRDLRTYKKLTRTI